MSLRCASWLHVAGMKTALKDASGRVVTVKGVGSKPTKLLCFDVRTSGGV